MFIQPEMMECKPQRKLTNLPKTCHISSISECKVVNVVNEENLVGPTSRYLTNSVDKIADSRNRSIEISTSTRWQCEMIGLRKDEPKETVQDPVDTEVGRRG